MLPERVSQRSFFVLMGLLFAASGAATIIGCASMPAMRGMPMPGGWTMSMTWMRMPGQTWLGSAASFLFMWVAMMVAMMLPSVTPVLLRHRQALANTGETHLNRLSALVGLGYFFVWIVFGLAAFPLGVALAAMEMQLPPLARSVPIAVGVVVMIAGALQFTAWKAHQLACCRAVRQDRPACHGPAACQDHRWPLHAGEAWKYGLRIGLRCCYCCAGPTAILFVSGIMNLSAMAVVTAVITLERLAPAGERVARATGAVMIGAGLVLIVRAAALG
jgi:predicted metal-binding membrane protein